MGKVKIECLFLASAIYIVVTVLLLHSHRAADAAELSSGDEKPHPKICNGDLKKLMFSCTKCIRKGSETVEPKALCCRTIQKLDLLCICQNVPASYYEKKIDMAKFVSVAEKCDMPIPSGTKCGDYTVPMIM